MKCCTDDATIDGEQVKLSKFFTILSPKMMEVGWDRSIPIYIYLPKFLEQDLGGPIAAEKPKQGALPARYHGQYGFAPDVPSEQNPIAGAASAVS